MKKYNPVYRNVEVDKEGLAGLRGGAEAAVPEVIVRTCTHVPMEDVVERVQGPADALEGGGAFGNPPPEALPKPVEEKDLAMPEFADDDIMPGENGQGGVVDAVDDGTVPSFTAAIAPETGVALADHMEATRLHLENLLDAAHHATLRDSSFTVAGVGTEHMQDEVAQANLMDMAAVLQRDRASAKMPTPTS